MQALIVDDDIATVDVVENSIDWKSLGVTERYLQLIISVVRRKFFLNGMLILL